MIIAFVRSLILYLIIIFGIRLLGKHQVSELEPPEFVLAMIIADVAAVPMQDYGIPLTMGIIPIVTLLCLSMILSILTMKSLKLRAFLSGVPSILIQDGEFNQTEMRRSRTTLDEILEELRLQGYTDPSLIQYAILETNGQLTILPFNNQKPPSAEDLGLQVNRIDLPVIIINDGRILSRNLKQRGLTEEWLNKLLKKHQIANVKSVFLLTLDQNNNPFLVLKELN